MYQQICIKTAEIILSVLVPETEIKDNAICNPQNYYGTIHRLLSRVLGIVSNHNLNGLSSSNPKEAFAELKSTLSSNCVFVQNFEKSSKPEYEALDAFQSWFKGQNFGVINISDLYELMLSLEFPIKDGTIVKDFEDEVPNTIGSFYTPANLADTCVELTLDNFIFQNSGIVAFSQKVKSDLEIEQVSELLKTSTYADYSVGTGSFIIAVLRYIDAHLSGISQEIKTAIVLNFNAIEADSLALEIAKIEVLQSINRVDLYQDLNANFNHGNPLLKPIQTQDGFEYSDEFYYHNGLAIERDELKKADVILANPPWGEVGFDLAYFCRVVLPKMTDVKSQIELENVLGNLEFSHPHLFDWLLEHEEANDLAVDEIYEDERFENSTNGGLHTNVLFTELLNDLTTKKGAIGLILKGSTLSDSANKSLTNLLSANNRIQARFDFLNTNELFNIDKDEEFSIVILGSSNSSEFPHKTGLTQLEEV